MTLFERIDLCDAISFKTNKSGCIRIDCDHSDVPLGSRNLVYKVADLLKNDFGICGGVDIQIKKRIPVAAGLGGGSSNAATALLGLNKLWKLRLQKRQLLLYANQVGSDVAFFLYGCPWAVGTEKGEKIKKLNIRSKLWHILVVPRLKIRSARIYKNLRWPQINLSTRSKGEGSHSRGIRRRPQEGYTNLLTKAEDNVNILTRYLKISNINRLEQGLINDLEVPILRLYPQLRNVKQRLKSLDLNRVMISGSGPSIFGIVSTKQEAELIHSALAKRFSQVFVVKTL